MKDILERLQGAKVLVVGDLMVDNYQWGEVERISPEAPVPVVKVVREEFRLGGAANVAANLAALGCRVGVCGVVGQDAMAGKALELLGEMGAAHEGVFGQPGRPTTEKTRVMARNQQLIRFDREDPSPPPPAVAKRLQAYLKREIKRYDGVIVSDYGKGLIGPALVATVTEAAAKAGGKVLADPKGLDFCKYAGVSCLTPNESEAAQASRVPITSGESAVEAGRALMAELGLERLCITRGAEGVLALEGGEHRLLPAQAREVYDVTGAGDTFIGTLGALWFSGRPFFESVQAANLAAGVAVGKLGTATVTGHEILAAAEGPSKAYTGAEMAGVAESLRARSRRIVFTNGCFDLLHTGHIQYLQASRALGDVLVVGLNSDASVRRLKGSGRPVIEEADRAHLLGALSCVDYVVVFEEDDPRELIRRVRPDILTKGADYTVETVVGHDLLAEWGGEVRLIPLTEDRSTSGIIKKIARGSA